MKPVRLFSVAILLAVGANQALAQNPVTQKEVDNACKKVLSSFSANLNLPTHSIKLNGGNTVATRGYIIQRFHSMFTYIKPKFLRKPDPAFKKSKIDSKGLSTVEAALLRTLVDNGFVQSNSPLATGKITRFSTTEFGTDLGKFIVQAAELTHKSDPKYSPRR